MIKMKLQLFAEEAGAANSGTGTEAATAAKTAGAEPAAVGKNYTEAEIDKLVEEKSTKKADAIRLSVYQQNGMTEDEAKKAFEDYKTKKATQDEADKGNLTAMQKKAEDAKVETEKVKAERFNDLIEARSESVAKDLGIDLAQLPYIKLDFSKVGKDDAGKPKKDDIKAVLEAALKAMPSLKAKEPAFTKGVASTNGGGALGTDDARMRKAFGLPATKKEK